MNSKDTLITDPPKSPNGDSGRLVAIEDDGTTPERGNGATAEDSRLPPAGTRSAEAINASELSYRRLFEAARDGILILEAETGRIVDVNPFLAAMLGYSHDELVGTPVWELGPFRDIVPNKAKFVELQLKRYVRYENLPLKTRHGCELAVEFVSNVYQAGGRDVIQCNVRDITGRRRMEEQIRAANAELEQRVLERTAQLCAANEELQAFSYSVSHDLRAPLRHLLGFAQLLQNEAGPSLSETSLGHLTTIFQSARRMENLIDDLLAFARIGLSDLQKETIHLDELVQEALLDFREEIKNRQIVWNIHALPAVRADRTLLRLALVNLISNAVKFTGARPKAAIAIGCVPGGSAETVIFIRDNGAGFDPSQAGRLFGVFQRLHSAEEFEGTGIGLANVKRIIQRHGGRVWAEGAVDQGAVFYFSIPKNKGDPHGR